MAGQKITDFTQFLTSLYQNTEPIVLYGAGIIGERTYSILTRAGYSVNAFCDGNPSKVGTSFCGCPVIGISQLAEQKNAFILMSLSISYIDEACRALFDAGVPQVYYMPFTDPDFSFLSYSKDFLPHMFSPSDAAIALVASMPHKNARETFSAWLYYFLTGDDRPLCAREEKEICREAELCIDGEKLPMFRRLLETASSCKLTFSNDSPNLLAFFSALPNMGYCQFHFVKHGKQILIGGWKL